MFQSDELWSRVAISRTVATDNLSRDVISGLGPLVSEARPRGVIQCGVRSAPALCRYQRLAGTHGRPRKHASPSWKKMLIDVTRPEWPRDVKFLWVILLQVHLDMCSLSEHIFALLHQDLLLMQMCTIDFIASSSTLYFVFEYIICFSATVPSCTCDYRRSVIKYIYNKYFYPSLVKQFMISSHTNLTVRTVTCGQVLLDRVASLVRIPDSDSDSGFDSTISTFTPY